MINQDINNGKQGNSMKRITLYDEEVNGNDADHFKTSFGWTPGSYITKRELREYQDQLRIQKEEYEQRNRTFLSDELKRAWWN